MEDDTTGSAVVGGNSGGETNSAGDGESGEDPAGASDNAARETADVAFGETYTYENGLAVSVSEPEAYMPSATSVNGGEPDFVTFTVTVVNGSTGDIASSDVFVTVQSGGGEAGEVMDPDAGIVGAPAEVVAPGGDRSWPLAFGVLSAGDVLVRVQPGIDVDPVSFG